MEAAHVGDAALRDVVPGEVGGEGGLAGAVTPATSTTGPGEGINQTYRTHRSVGNHSGEARRRSGSTSAQTASKAGRWAGSAGK